MKPALKRVAPALAYVALAVADATLAGREGTTARRLRFVTKPALMPTLSVAMHQAKPGDPLVRAGVTTAQAFSWGGDVALLGSSEKAFLGGVGSFFGAHLAYIAHVRGSSRPGPHERAPRPQGSDAALADHRASHVRRRLATRTATSPARSPPTAPRSRRCSPPRPCSTRSSHAAVGEPSPPERRCSSPRTPCSARRSSCCPRRTRRLEVAVMATYTAAQGLIAAGATAL